MKMSASNPSKPVDDDAAGEASAETAALEPVVSGGGCEPMEHSDKSARCLLVRAGRVLLVTHSNCSLANRGKWALPGGRLEAGESPRGTLRRELQEELELDIERLNEVGRYVSRHRWHRVYWAECAEGPERWDPAEIDEVRWFDPEDVAALETGGQLHYGFEAQVVADWMQGSHRESRDHDAVTRSRD